MLCKFWLSQIMSICYFLFTCENEVGEYCSGKAPCASQKASLQDQTTVSNKSEDNKLLKETIEQGEERQMEHTELMPGITLRVLLRTL